MLALSLFHSTTMACNFLGTEGIAPDNDSYYPEDFGLFSSEAVLTMDEATFNDTLDKVEATYAPIFKGLNKEPLKVIRKWSNGTVNAVAYPRDGFSNIEMYGGLARHPEATADALALVACHEIGHHIGGVPKVKMFLFVNSWAANEGQSDYFGSLKCFRKVFENEDNLAAIANFNIPDEVDEKCGESFNDGNEYGLCVRNAMAGRALARLLASLRKSTMPQFNTPDTTVRKWFTYNQHPEAQCRLDTYFAGASCSVSHNEDISQKEPKQGTCEGMDWGARPNCWYASKGLWFSEEVIPQD